MSQDKVEQTTAYLNSALAAFSERNFCLALEHINSAEALSVPVWGLAYLKASVLIQLKRYSEVMRLLDIDCSRAESPSEASQLMSQIRQGASFNPCFATRLSSPGRFLISGIPPGSSGTGQLLRALMPDATAAGFKLIAPMPGMTFNEAELLHLCEVHDSDIVLVALQDIKFHHVKSLIENNNRVTLFVTDNSFFCIRSYNHRPERFGECLDCLSALERCHESCHPFPNFHCRDEALDFLTWLKGRAHSIRFMCQTAKQADLVQRHFNNGIGKPGVRCTVVGMRTPEYSAEEGGPTFDIVFHASPLPAKGILYTLELARRLPEYSFLIPSKIDEATSYCGAFTPPSNVTFEDMKWNTGLKNHVLMAKLVLCPSQWSSPVEGAVMKSLYFNGSVAMLETEFGLDGELPKDLILRLSPVPELAIHQVREFMTNGNSRRELARRFVDTYNTNVSYKIVFETGATSFLNG